MVKSTTMELRIFLLVVLFCALAASLPSNQMRERRTSHPVLRDKARDAMKTKQFRIGYRYGRAWEPPTMDDDNALFDMDTEGEALKYELQRMPMSLVLKLLAELRETEADDGY